MTTIDPTFVSLSYTSECQKSVYGGPLRDDSAIDMEPCGQVPVFHKNLIYIREIDCVPIINLEIRVVKFNDFNSRARF